MNEGTYGKVYISDDRVVKKSKYDLCETFLREIYFSNVVPFAIKPLSVWIQRRINIAYPYGGENAIMTAHALPLKQKLNMVFQLLCKVKWLHQNGILHNDLMSGNLLYESGSESLHIIDWGLTNYVALGSVFEIYSCYFKAPELCRNDKKDDQHKQYYNSCEDLRHSYETDVWAIGVLVIMIFSEDPEEARRLVCKNQLIPNLRKLGIPPLMYDIVRHSLCEKTQRWSVERILAEPVFHGMAPMVWDPPAYKYAEPPHYPVYKDCILYMYKILNALGWSGAVLGNAIHLFCAYTMECKHMDEETHMLAAMACISISNKVLGTLDDAAVHLYKMINNVERYWSLQITILRIVNPHFIIHPIRYGSLKTVCELYLNAMGLTTNTQVQNDRNQQTCNSTYRGGRTTPRGGGRANVEGLTNA